MELTQWLRRARGAIGIGMAWAVAWSGAGAIMVLGILLRTGSRPDPPFPLMFGVFGFLAGVLFSAVLGRDDGRHRLDRMSLARAATWGASIGFLLFATFAVTVALAGDRAFLRNLVVVGPIAAAAAAGSAAGSLVLARRTQRWRQLTNALRSSE